MSPKTLGQSPSKTVCGSSPDISVEVMPRSESDTSSSMPLAPARKLEFRKATQKGTQRRTQGKTELPIERLRELFDYDPETGIVIRKITVQGSFQAGTVVGYYSKFGYLRVFVNRRALYLHRVIWALAYGEQPPGEIDHINGVKDDNRLCNLRVVSLQENGRNAARSCANTSGVTGVYWDARRKKWYSQIGSPTRTIGLFHSFEEAVAARKEAEVKLGFHPNHGRDPVVGTTFALSTPKQIFCKKIIQPT